MSLDAVSWEEQTPSQVDEGGEYFERCRELLVPFTASDTGRRHHREIVDHRSESLHSSARLREFMSDTDLFPTIYAVTC
ncbi:hypothetical protein BRC91_12990 [Halobacteriales archaeon QS_4_62_28]|nr:MAG: hypothetical protein BRC91_12990 [Halobacteriales archaeon QS_4_62_28]